MLLPFFSFLLFAGATTATTVTIPDNLHLKYDVNGSSLDAHDGHIKYFDGQYVLYGTSYDCGYRWNNPRPTSQDAFCGIKVYTSPNLVSWTYEGYAYDKEKYPNPGFRPKVEYRNATSTYYLFFNDIGKTAETSLAIYTSNSSTGPFEFASYGHTVSSIGDFGVQQDENSSVWIAYSAGIFGNATLEKMTDDWLNGTGITSVLPISSVEAHALTIVDREWYWTFGSLCGYCNSTDTSYVKASTPFGPWSKRRYISEDSCGGQSSFLSQIPNPSGGQHIIYGSDLWFGGSPNQAKAPLHLEPVIIANGKIRNLTCPDSFHLDVVVANRTSSRPNQTHVDATAGATGFKYACDLPPMNNLQSGARIQTWTVGQSGNLTEVGFNIGQQNSDGSLSVQLFSFKNYSDILDSADYTGTITISASSALFPNNPVANWVSLSDGEYMAENTTWSLDNYVLRPNVAVQKGDRLALFLKPVGTISPFCYAYKNASRSKGQKGLVRLGGASVNPQSTPASWFEDGRELKFYAVVE